MSDRACVQCGRPLVGLSARARYCGSTCRARRAKGHPSVVTAPGAVVTSGGRVTAAVLAELDAAERAKSALGIAALGLAERVDNGAAETGQAFAALTKALRETLALALSGAPRAADAVDELQRRRARKLGKAARGGEL